MILPKNITAKEFRQALEKEGFKETRKRGGHLVFRHPDGRRVILSYHKSGGTFPPKTLKSMIQDAGWTEEDLRRLGILS
ncbi:MAG TPA: type II toxin-antitoxin system HicA family toxin [Thermodesulfovibrionales bacterium]|nr:type II toxin-antitoxin system HicA family toxin [Thermodesulfovibrionales bacterium]